jgi:outer membrane protein TolC
LCILHSDGTGKVRLMPKLILFLLTAPLWAQDTLSLRDAVRLALRENPSITATAAETHASEKRILQARSGALPKVDYAESWARSDNPVFVFGSLLTQHQFGLQDFNLGPLNRPDFLNNFQSLVTVDQPLYDAGQTRHAINSAQLSHNLSTEEQRRVQMETIANVTRAYYGAVLAAESLKTAEQAVRSAEADLQRAESVRAAGMSTDADVLSIRVHLAAVQEQRIQRSADLDVARAALNDALGLALDTPHSLTSALEPLKTQAPDLAVLEHDVATERPEAREARLAVALAQTQAETARGTLKPTVSFHAAFEADRQRFVDRGGANWLASVSMCWNLFNGFADKERIAESEDWLQRAKANEQRAGSALSLQVRHAKADLESAEQRIEVARAAVAEAEESLRITQNRYEAGMSNVTELLRSETAVLEIHTRYLAAIHDQRVAATMLELAAGRLTPDSEVLN